MESKVLAAVRRYEMLKKGDRVICAVSGGADSMALLWCLWLNREKLGIAVEAAHFNHHLRGEESQRDGEFVRNFCDFHDIPLHYGEEKVVPGAKGLEAAAREARYAFLRSLNGIIATAHTADDNAETVLMHLIRGTGLRGLGGITPKADRLIRPMLDVTRQEVEEFLRENWISHVEDSSNASDDFLRNRVRHGVMPQLKQENPSLSQSLTAMAQRLRRDEALLQELARKLDCHDVAALRKAHPALRTRALEKLLKEIGLPEPSASHIAQAESLVFSEKPSAFAAFPGGIVLRRNYDRLESGSGPASLEQVKLPRQGKVVLPQIGMEVRCTSACRQELGTHCFTVRPCGEMILRSRQSGDTICLSGGRKSVKKLFIDRKIPAAERPAIPIVADETGLLGICGIGPDRRERTGDDWVKIEFVKISDHAEE